MSHAALAHFRDRLLRRREELVELQDVSRAVRGTVVQARLAEGFGPAEALECMDALDALERDELREIDAALDRMAQGRFGLCVACGLEIDPGRLGAVPEEKLCAGCSIEAEAR